jgi:solute:Na+ symporter, SSS family
VGLYATEMPILLIYLIATFGIAFYFGRRSADGRSPTSYFLADRNLPWPLVGLSFYASNMSGASFVGLIGASYSHGLAVFHYEWTAVVVLVLFSVLVLPVFLRNRLFTVPEYLERRFEPRTRTVYSVFTILTLLFIDTAGALYAGAIVVVTGLPFLDLWMACILISLFTGIYTIFGGLRTVVLTDALQAVVLIAGAAVVAIFGLIHLGGWDALLERSSARHVELFRPPGDSFLPWPGIGGVIILGLYYWAFNQYFVQRALAARSLADGRKGALFGGLLKLPNLLLMIVPGLVAAALYPNLDSPDKAFPTLAFELLPAGLRGIVLAAMLAAIMSSLDSALNAASSLVTMDVIRPLRPNLQDRALFTIGRVVTAAFMTIAAIYAPLIASFGSLFEYFQATLAYLVPPFVAIYLGGLLSRRLARNSAFWTLLVIEPVAIALYLAKEVSGVWAGANLPDLHFTYIAMALFVLTIGAMTVLTVVLPPAREPIDPAATLTRGDLANPASAEGAIDYRIPAAVLLLVTALLLLGLAVRGGQT